MRKIASTFSTAVAIHVSDDARTCTCTSCRSKKDFLRRKNATRPLCAAALLSHPKARPDIGRWMMDDWSTSARTGLSLHRGRPARYDDRRAAPVRSPRMISASISECTERKKKKQPPFRGSVRRTLIAKKRRREVHCYRNPPSDPEGNPWNSSRAGRR